MSLLWLLCLLQLWGVVNPYDESPFVVPTLEGTNVEFYDSGQIRYEIHLERVPFMVARQICLSHNGSLLELKLPSVGDFIGQALAESAAAHSSLWIGGEYFPATSNEQGVWKWLSGESLIEEPIPEDFTFPMLNPPYWVDRPDLNSTEAACLVTDRCLHYRPLVTGMPCNVKRAFICEVVAVLVPSAPFEVTPLVINKDKVFHLFHAEYTWQQSFAMCKRLGYQLAVITKPEELTKLQTRMQRVRPIIENAWTSGAFVNGKWIWVSTSEEINTVQNATNKRDFPPWYQPDNITMAGCLLADRHVCDYFVYVEARCDRKRNFICQLDKAKDNAALVEVPGTQFFVSTVKLNWFEAQKKCAECLKAGTLFQLAFHNPELLEKHLIWLFKAMTSISGLEIRHVWMNAYLHNLTFYWGNNYQKPILNDVFDMRVHAEQFSNKSNSLLGDSGDNGFIVFCPGNVKDDPYLRHFKCLNLDRENLKYFFMYGLDCGYKQHFLCMAENGDGPTYILQDTCKKPVKGIGARDIYGADFP